MKQASTKTVKCAMNAAGAFAPMNQKSTAATRNVIAVAFADAGSLAAPCPFGAGGGFAAGLGAGADTFGAGGGQVTLPSLITVSPRMASSSMLTLMTPSFVLHSSSASRKRFVPYSVEDCFASRLGRSV